MHVECIKCAGDAASGGRQEAAEYLAQAVHTKSI